MRRKLKKFRVLIFALSILMSYCLVHPYDRGTGIYFLPFDPNLENRENADQEDPAFDPPTQSKGVLSNSFKELIHHGMHAFQGSSLLPSAPFSSTQKISILRC